MPASTSYGEAMVAYRPMARILHWITAILIIGMVIAGTLMLQKGIGRSVQDTLFLFHKNTGLIVLVLIVWRLVYRAISPPPPLPDSVSAMQRRLAGLNHAALYILVMVMAVSGYIRVLAGGYPLELPDALGLPHLVTKSESLADVAQAVHFWTHYAVIALIVLHLAAALFHAVVKRDGVFSRMWPAAGR